ncbi:hypothetical protein FYK55_20415 [Roseiconus nitratireducens]|uniref:Uncharacterized protein n=1 Tax=Roseiconus nitratireducens TaxID=2605748 RepID=A0A5M6D4R4_9BACT|nr:hypothetical protein [Roseiconus nitratireducens]KAA5540749.1 hypothetical protein FYK55_20415 [Roseiconus nitratireducens]
MTSRFALLLLLAFGTLGPVHAVQSTEGVPAAANIADRLDEILKRLDRIERQLLAIQTQQRNGFGWWVDENGVMRLPSGRPIGHWGVDSPQVPAQPIQTERR